MSLCFCVSGFYQINSVTVIFNGNLDLFSSIKQQHSKHLGTEDTHFERKILTHSWLLQDLQLLSSLGVSVVVFCMS